MKKIAMFGICGKMGKVISVELLKENDVELVAGFDSCNKGIDVGEVLGTKKLGFSVTDSYKKISKAEPDVIIDFTVANIAIKNIQWALDNKIDIIVGTTGIKSEILENFKKQIQNQGSKVLLSQILQLVQS